MNKDDSLYERSVLLELRLSGVQIITTDLILIELLDGVSVGGAFSRQNCAEFIENIWRTTAVIVEPYSVEAWNATFNLWRDRLDKEWSFTDCFSFVVMNKWKITEAPAYDHHFVQAGFRALLRETEN